MVVVGIGLAYVGYVGVLWGVCLITGKNVSLGQLFARPWPPGGGTTKTPPGGPGTGTTQAPGTTTAGGRG